MADVTISQLTQGTPNGNNLLPYSTGSNTLSVPVSALLQNTNNVGIGVNASVYGNNLILRGSDSPTFIGKQPLGLGILNGGNYDLAGIDFKNLTGNSLAGRIGVEVTGGGGYMKFGTSNNYASGINNTALIIDPIGAVTKPSQPAFAVQADNTSYVHPANSLVRILAFTGKLFDVGNNFNTSLSRFTAAAGGIYSFSGMLRTNPSPNGWLYPSFFVNGVQYGNASLPGLSWNQNPNSSGFGTSNFHTLIKLNAGDYVDYYFGVGSAGTYQIDGQSIWYGYLLG